MLHLHSSTTSYPSVIQPAPIHLHRLQDDVAKLEIEMDERHAAETAALEQREHEAAGPQEETTDILATDLYSFSLSAAETQKQVRHLSPPHCCLRCSMDHLLLFSLQEKRSAALCKRSDKKHACC